MQRSRVTLTLTWTRTGDAVPNRRCTELVLTYPTAEVLDALTEELMALEASQEVTLDGEREQVTPEAVRGAVILANAVTQQKRAQAEAEAAVKTEREQRERAEKRTQYEAMLDAGEAPNSFPYLNARERHLRDPWPDWALGYLSEEYRERALSANAEYHQRRKDAEAEANARQAERDEAYEAEKAAWIEAHGSDRLKEQVALGYDGWPLYLHERIASDLGEHFWTDWALREDADEWKSVSNPTPEQLAQERELRDRLTAVGQAEAETEWRLRPSDPDADEDADWLNWYPELVVLNWRLSPHRPTKTYTVVVGGHRA